MTTETAWALLFSRSQMLFRVERLEYWVNQNISILPHTRDWAVIGLFDSKQTAINNIPIIAEIKGLVWSEQSARWE